uniref:Uncharacterized protein n=1 Tax=Arundo donax TaxID=35708 RepID=A0A0A8ZSN2_ARUDO
MRAINVTQLLIDPKLTVLRLVHTVSLDKVIILVYRCKKIISMVMLWFCLMFNYMIII